ncbi:MAG: hypothetical protein LBR90_02740 [Elusimicrobiota bacterium]|jgi:hypothetical protein|nr:hypothetical protein [Elusimicrobiota bacterium]
MQNIKKYFTFLAFFALALCCAKAAFASISLYPYSLEFDADSRRRVQNVRVINNSQEVKTYRVSFVNYVQTPEGSYREHNPEADAAVATAQEYLYFSPRQFTLKPGAVQTLNIMRRPAADMKDGEYVSHLKISEVDVPLTREEAAQKSAAARGEGEQTLSIQLKALYAVTIPVSVYKGKLESAAQITKAQVITRQDGKTVLQLAIAASGSKSARGDISVSGSKSKAVGQLNNVRVYPYNNERSASVPLTQTEEELKGQTLTITFKDKQTGKNVAERKLSL